MSRDTDPPIPLIPYAVSQGLSDEDLLALWDDEVQALETAFEQGVSAQLPAVQQGLHLRVVHVRDEACALSH